MGTGYRINRSVDYAPNPSTRQAKIPGLLSLSAHFAIDCLREDVNTNLYNPSFSLIIRPNDTNLNRGYAFAAKVCNSNVIFGRQFFRPLCRVDGTLLKDLGPVVNFYKLATGKLCAGL